jgi:hypothetical protein
VNRLLPLLVLPVLLAATESPVVEGTWRSTEVPGFIVYGDVEPSVLYEVANRLATLRAVLGRFATGLELGGERPLPVYAFRSSEDFARYAECVRPGGERPRDGYFATGHGYSRIAIDRSATDRDAVVYHELAHYVIHRNYGSVPLWFNEGTAKLYETLQTTSTTATVGVVPRSRVVWLNTHAMMPVESLARVTEDSPDYSETDRAGTFYYQSSLLVHYLLLGNPSRGPQLVKYLENIHAGTSPDVALEGAFEGGAEALDKELRDYVARGEFKSVTLRFDQLPVPRPSDARTLGDVEALDALGALALVCASKDEGLAASLFRAALEKARDDPRARGGRAALAVVNERYADALPDAEAAFAGGVDDPALFVLAARAILEVEHERVGTTVKHGAPPSANILKARGWLARAIKADSMNRTALVDYAETFVAAGDDPASGIAALERADALDPLDDTDAFNLLELRVRKRDRGKAEAYFETRIQPKAKSEVVQAARESLLRLDVEDASDAIDAGEYARALRLIRGVRDRTTRDAMRANANRVIAELEGKVAAASRKKPAATASPGSTSKPKP